MEQQNPRLVATVIWGALLAGPAVFLGVALYLVHGLRGGAGLLGPIHELLLPVLGATLLSAVTVALSWRWAVRMAGPASGGVALRAGAIPPGPGALGVTRLIVACALCEGSALVAIVAFLLTGSALLLGPFALSWLAQAAHFPGDRHWARLTAGGGRGAMIRG